MDGVGPVVLKIDARSFSIPGVALPKVREEDVPAVLDR
jgi:hypothetical protein